VSVHNNPKSRFTLYTYGDILVELSTYVETVPMAGQDTTIEGFRSNLKDWHEAGFIGGSPQQIVDQMSVFEEAGVSRFILEHNSFYDQSPLELLAEKVLPVGVSS